jgi:hypothetical protein
MHRIGSEFDRWSNQGIFAQNYIETGRRTNIPLDQKCWTVGLRFHQCLVGGILNTAENKTTGIFFIFEIDFSDTTRKVVKQSAHDTDRFLWKK